MCRRGHPCIEAYELIATSGRPTTAAPGDKVRGVSTQPEQRDIRVMIIDDHEVVRRGIAEVVDRADGLTVVAEAGSVAETLRSEERRVGKEWRSWRARRCR